MHVKDAIGTEQKVAL